MALKSGTAPCKLQFLRLLVTCQRIIYSTDLYLILNMILTEWCLSLNEYNEVNYCPSQLELQKHKPFGKYKSFYPKYSSLTLGFYSPMPTFLTTVLNNRYCNSSLNFLSPSSTSNSKKRKQDGKGCYTHSFISFCMLLYSAGMEFPLKLLLSA